MHSLRAAGAAIVLCLVLGGLPALAQEAESGAVLVTSRQECSFSTGRCTFTASDPRVTGTGTISMTRVVSTDAGTPILAWGEYTLDGPDGTWSGHHHAVADATGSAHVSMRLSGAGAYEGWQYVAAGTDQGATGELELIGVLYKGPPPPVGAPAAEASSAAALATIGEPADDGARIIEVEELGERMVDLTIDSPAVGTQRVRLLLPAGFDRGAEAQWPVLYLLHGAVNDYTSWTRETDVEELTADLPLLVVMPDAGWEGWYADWWNGGAGGPPMWETFHTSELPELLERNWQAGDERAVAGLSMGGLGAMTYAARHPGLFRAAASFSGMLHPVTLDPTATGFDVPADLWGDRTEQADVWEAHDPVLLAPALEGIALYVGYGSGEPGPLDAADATFDELEASFAVMNEVFAARLAELGIPVTVDTGPGTHTMPYVERGLHQALPLLLEALGM